MTSLPLHPAIVHLPLGLAFVLPLLSLGLAWALWTGRVRSRAWLTIVALQALLLGAGLVAMNTGEREEGRVEAVVPDSAIGHHEELAEQFVWATGVTLGLAALVLVSVRRPVASRVLVSATVVGTVIVAAAAIRVGRAGGELVYRYNAGGAYASSPASITGEETATTAEKRPSAAQRDRDRDDHRD